MLSPDTLTLQQHQGLGLLGLGGGDAFMVKLDKGFRRCGFPPHTDLILTLAAFGSRPGGQLVGRHLQFGSGGGWR